MGDVDTLPGQLAALEEALVSEFRAYQMLAALTRDERQALLHGDLPLLEQATGSKEKTLADLARLEVARQAALSGWARLAGVETVLTLSELMPRVPAPVAERLGRLRDGILALVSEVHDITQGNRVLAQDALERVEAGRRFLLSLVQPSEGYQPVGVRSRPVDESALTVQQWA